MRLGILGTGNMGEAILRGVLVGGAIAPELVTIFDLNTEKTKQLSAAVRVHIADSIPDLFQKSDIVLLAVKPNVCEGIFNQYRASFSGKAIISIIAGWSQEHLHACLPNDVRILRVMPNTPAMVSEGMIVFEKGNTLTDEEEAFAFSLFNTVGKTISMDGNLMDAVTAVSGSGPAYVYVFIEALADGGVLRGLPRKTAYELAAQTVLGAARMVLDTGLHPGELKDNVCSPNGTTIAAIASLERDGFRGAVMEAVDACYQRSKELSNNI